jgi:hypothetical protein
MAAEEQEPQTPRREQKPAPKPHPPAHKRSRLTWPEKQPAQIPDIHSFTELVNILRAQLHMALEKVADLETPGSFRPGYTPIVSLYNPMTEERGGLGINVATKLAANEFSSQINPTIEPKGMSGPKTGGAGKGTISQLALTELDIFFRTYLQAVQNQNPRAYDLAVDRSWNEIGKYVRSPEAVMINQKACRKIGDNMYSSDNPQINPKLRGQMPAEYGGGSQLSPQQYCDYASQVKRMYDYIIAPIHRYVQAIENKSKERSESQRTRSSRIRYDVLQGRTENLELA